MKRRAAVRQNRFPPLIVWSALDAGRLAWLASAAGRAWLAQWWALARVLRRRVQRHRYNHSAAARAARHRYAAASSGRRPRTRWTVSGSAHPDVYARTILRAAEALGQRAWIAYWNALSTEDPIVPPVAQLAGPPPMPEPYRRLAWALLGNASDTIRSITGRRRSYLTWPSRWALEDAWAWVDGAAPAAVSAQWCCDVLDLPLEPVRALVRAGTFPPMPSDWWSRP